MLSQFCEVLIRTHSGIAALRSAAKIFREALVDLAPVDGAVPWTKQLDHAGNWTCMAWANSEARSALRMNPSAMALSRLVVYAAR